MRNNIQVLIVDDHPIVRSGLITLLKGEEDIEFVGEAANGKEAIELTERFKPDVILMDVSMPVLDGINATLEIKEKFPNIQILVLTIHQDDEYFFEMLRAGASGYILKTAKTVDLVEAIRMVSQGEVFLYPSMVKKLLHGYLELSKWEVENRLGLSPREKKILFMVAEGHSFKTIAERLVISQSTVNSHCSNLIRKLGLNNRRELFLYARNRGVK